jgi:RNA polymerase sigma factor (sigma-70 family)
MDDWDLLEQFRRARSERAFGELVRRHAGFVLVVCRRRLRDGHDAEDAAQAVFLVLARRPPARSGSGALAGWLYKTAIYVCNNTMRAKRARATHERSAAAERATVTRVTDDPRGGGRGGDRGRGHDEVLLDRALAELSSKERDAVLLRYYQAKSVQQVGAMLGISQNTASKRIARAVERMRRFLADKGFAITAPALVESFTRTMREPVASREFIAQAVSIGTGQSTAPAIVQQLAEGVDFVIRIAKLKLVACAVIVVITACGGIVSMNQLMAQDAKPRVTQPAQPASRAQPATQPAERTAQDFDPSTPKGALRAFARATRGADFETLARVSKTGAGDDLEIQLIAASNNYNRGMGELFAAVRDKFGEGELRKFARQRGAIPLEPFLRLIEAELDEHDVVVEGDTAKLVDRRDPTNETNIKLVREEGVWKVASTGLLAQFGEERIAQRLEMLRSRAQILLDVAADVAADKYENIDAVGEGLKEALRR